LSIENLSPKTNLFTEVAKFAVGCGAAESASVGIETSVDSRGSDVNSVFAWIFGETDPAAEFDGSLRLFSPRWVCSLKNEIFMYICEIKVISDLVPGLLFALLLPSQNLNVRRDLLTS
jgi:hypothetical protein